MVKINRYVTIAMAAVMTFFAAGCDKTEIERKDDGGSASGDVIGISAVISDSQSKVSYTEKYDGDVFTGLKLAWVADDPATANIDEADRIFGYIVKDGTKSPLVYRVTSIVTDPDSEEYGKATFETAAGENGNYTESGYANSYQVYTLTDKDASETVNIYFIARSNSVPESFFTDLASSKDFSVDLQNQSGTLEGLDNYAYICAESNIKSSQTQNKKVLELIFHNQFAIMKYDQVAGLVANKTYTFHLKGSGLYNKGTIPVPEEGSFGFIPDGAGEITAQITTDATGKVDNLFFVVPAGTVTNLTVYATEDGSTDNYSDDKIYQSIAFEAGNVSRSTQTHQLIKRRYPVLPGLFTINSNGDKVQFSRGNLYGVSNTYVTDQTPASQSSQSETYNISVAEHWYFENNQYEFHGIKRKNIGLSFGNIPVDAYKYENEYGYLGYRVTTKYYGINDETHTVGDCFPPIANALKYHPSEFNDWGNDVDIRDNDGKTWRTLTFDEWKYLIYGRIGAQYPNSKSGLGTTWQIATIKISEDLTQNGILIYPDDNIAEKDKTKSFSSLSEWVVYEQLGCVFLPAASSVAINMNTENLGKYVRCWAASNDDTKAKYIQVNCTDQTITFEEVATSGAESTISKHSMSVRLVTSATPANSIGDLPYTTW